MKNSLYLFALLLVVTFFSSCEQNDLVDSQAQYETPVVPPAEIYTIPTEALNHASADTADAHRHGISYRNWVHSALNVFAWNTVIAINGAIPLASFARALNEDPVYIGNGTFEWSYTYRAPIAGDVYDIVLTAKYINNREDVEWVMTTSQRGGFSNFEWYRGVVSRDHTEASFILNHQPNNPEPYISIDYKLEPNTEEASIRYTNIIPTHEGRGGYIEYRVNSDHPYNRAYDVKAGPAEPTNFLQIQWNAPTNEGRVKHEKFYGDTEWHCWDTDLRDTDC